MTTSLTKVEKEHRLFTQTEILSTKVKELEQSHETEKQIQTQQLQDLKSTKTSELERLEKQMIDLKYALLPKPFMKHITDVGTKRLVLDKLMMQSGANIVDLERNIRNYANVTVMVLSIAGFSRIVGRLEMNPHLVLELMNRFYAMIEGVLESETGVYCIERVKIINQYYLSFRYANNVLLFVVHRILLMDIVKCQYASQ